MESKIKKEVFSLGYDKAPGPDGFLIFLEEQADLSPAAHISDVGERRSWVYDTLVETAERNKASLRGELDRTGLDYRPHYLINMIEVQGRPGLRRTFAKRPGVASVQFQPRCLQGRSAVVGDRTANCRTIAANRAGFVVVTIFQSPLNRTHPTNALLQLFLGVSVRLVNRLRSFSKVMEVAKLVRHTRQSRSDGFADRILAVGYDTVDRNVQDIGHRTDQLGKVFLAT